MRNYMTRLKRTDLLDMFSMFFFLLFFFICTYLYFPGNILSLDKGSVTEYFRSFPSPFLAVFCF